MDEVVLFLYRFLDLTNTVLNCRDLLLDLVELILHPGDLLRGFDFTLASNLLYAFTIVGDGISSAHVGRVRVLPVLEILFATQLNFLLLLSHFVFVALKLVGDFSAKYKCAVAMTDKRIRLRVRVDVRVRIVSRVLQSVKCHANELLIQ